MENLRGQAESYEHSRATGGVRPVRTSWQPARNPGGTDPGPAVISDYGFARTCPPGPPRYRDGASRLSRFGTRTNRPRHVRRALEGAACPRAWRQIEKLEEWKIALAEKEKNCTGLLGSFDQMFQTACAFLANPCKLWLSDRPADKRMVLRLAFAGKPLYHLTEGFQTAIPALPFKA